MLINLVFYSNLVELLLQVKVYYYWRINEFKFVCMFFTFSFFSCIKRCIRYIFARFIVFFFFWKKLTYSFCCVHELFYLSPTLLSLIKYTYLSLRVNRPFYHNHSLILKENSHAQEGDFCHFCEKAILCSSSVYTCYDESIDCASFSTNTVNYPWHMCTRSMTMF